MNYGWRPTFFQFFSKRHHLLSSWGLNRKLIPGILNVTCFSKISVAVCGLFDQRKWDDSTKTWWWFRSEAGITLQTWWTLTIWPTSMAGPPNLLRRTFGSPSSTRGKKTRWMGIWMGRSSKPCLMTRGYFAKVLILHHQRYQRIIFFFADLLLWQIGKKIPKPLTNLTLRANHPSVVDWS